MRFFKRFIFILFCVTAVIIAVSSALAYLYQDEIEQLIIEQLNKQLKAPIHADDVSFSILKKFPYTSLEFNNITAQDAFEKDTLLHAEKLFLKFNAVDLYNKNYHIQQVEIVSGKAAVYFDNKGTPSYTIWQTQKDTISATNSLQFGLDEVLLQKMRLSYHDPNVGLDVEAYTETSTMALSFHDGALEMQLNGQLLSQHLYAAKVNQLPNTNIDYWLTLDVGQGGTTLNGVCHLNNLQLKVNGHFGDGYNLEINTEKAALSELLSHIPSTYKSKIKDYHINGVCNIDLRLSNNATSKRSPSINANFQVNKGSLQSSQKWKLKDARFSGTYTNGTHRNNTSSTIDLKNIHCLVNNETLQGDANLQNLDHPILQTNFHTQLALSSLKLWGAELPLQQLEGNARISGSYTGAIGIVNKPYDDFKAAQKLFQIQITDGLLQYDSSITSLKHIQTHLTLDNDRLSIDSLRSIVGANSQITFTGALENLFSFSNTNPLKVAGLLIADKLLVEELYTSDSTVESSALTIPKNIQANLNLRIDDLTYDRFKMRSFHSKLSLNKDLIKLKDISLLSMSGSLKGELSLEQVPDGRIRLISSSHLENIPVRSLFYEFRDFGQESLKHKHLRGTLTADVYFRSEWDAYLNTLQDNLYSFVDLKITDGELIDFPPMLLMSDYISVNELKRIKFSTLENQIEIKNRMIEIPFMEIHSSAIDIAGSGSHSFDNEIDYEFKLLLNEILSGKFKRKNKEQVSEFGVEEDDGVKGMTLFLKMEGTVEDPDISYNTLRLRESLSDGFQKEKKELKEILQNEFNGYNQEENIDKSLDESPDYNNILEWEEDEHLF